jgi:signal recognition particle subunit SRP54
MFENLSDKLEKAFKTLKGQGRITEINVAATIKEIRRALLDADVNFKTAKNFTDRVKERAMGQNVLTAVSPGQLLTKITQDELANLMGGTSTDIQLSGNPAVILIAGLQGSGKTTFSGKLANMLKTKKGKRPLLVAGDVYRPAAIDQLHVLGEQIGVEVYSDKENKNPVEIANAGIRYARANAYDVVIVDTAGRLAVDVEMMNEIEAVKRSVNPSETLFVVDAMTGQDAVNTAKAFNERIDFDGVVLTKLDGDTRGGAAISIKSVVDKPLKFVGTGEKMDAIEVFHPDRMADRILGMGDVVSLVEKAQEHYDEKEARELSKKIAKNQFTFDDFLKQIHQIKKMGNVKDLMGMVPGMGKMMKGVDVDDKAFDNIEAIIYSMTPYERNNAQVINGSRKTRIAKGSGSTVQDVNKLIKQFSDMSKMMKMMNNKKGMAAMMQQMKGMKGMGGGFPGM